MPSRGDRLADRVGPGVLAARFPNTLIDQTIEETWSSAPGDDEVMR